MNGIYLFDIFVFGLTLLLALKGIVNGLIKEISGFLGIIGGVLVASKYSKEAGDFLASTFKIVNGNKDLAIFFGFLAILVIFWIICLFAGAIFSKLVKLSGLGILDRLGGFIFGGLKVFLIFSILFYCVTKISFLNSILQKYDIDGAYSASLLEKCGSYIMNDKRVQIEVNSVIQNSFDSNNTSEKLP